MNTFNIEFAATCDTKYGQKVTVCGNLIELGQWNPSKGLILQTDPKKYPLWTSKSPISVKQGIQLQFKLCILDSSLSVVRWQQIRGNRIFSAKDSLIVEFSESDASMIYKVPRHFSALSLGVQNVRKGTQQVFNVCKQAIQQWGSDSSSNRQMWRQHEFEDEQQTSLLLTQFTLQLKKAVASQKEQTFNTLQHQPDMQFQNQLRFGDFKHHFYNTHYYHSPYSINYTHSPKEIEDGENIAYISNQSLQSFNLVRAQQVSVFHLIGWKAEQLGKRASRIGLRWRSACRQRQKGLIVAYLQNEIEVSTVSELVESGVNVVVCNNYNIVRSIIQILDGLNYPVKGGQKDQFIIMLNIIKQFKIIFSPFVAAQVRANPKIHLDNIKQKILNRFYFGFSKYQFQAKLQQTFSLFRLNRHHCLIILNINHLQDLQAKTINQIVYLPSIRYKIIVFVITKQKFPKNIQHRISVSKNKMIFINSHGQIYSNNSQIINIFYYIEVTKIKFRENLQIIRRLLGEEGVQKYKKINELQVQIEFSKDILGQLMKRRALKCVHDVNNKSIAKIVPEINGDHITLVPFCLHSSFLIRVILKTFSYRLRDHQKGLVINIDGQELKSLTYLQVPEGRQLNMNFLKFYLEQEQNHSNYSCNPINQQQLQKFIQIISQEVKEDEFDTPKKYDILCDVKNLR